MRSSCLTWPRTVVAVHGRRWFTKGSDTSKRGVAKLSHAATASVETLESRMFLSAVVVNSISDTSTGDGVVTLRDAIDDANSSGDPTTITFDSTVFAAPQTIVLDGSQLELSNTSEPTTIIGPAAGVTISGNNASRVLLVDASVTVSISGVSVTNGNIVGPGDDIGPDSAWGGGISNGGILTLTNVTVANNSSSYVGGGIYNAFNYPGLAMSAAAGVMNLLDMVLPASAWAPSDKLIDELDKIYKTTALFNAKADLTAAAAGRISSASAAHAIAGYTAELFANGDAQWKLVKADLKDAGVALTIAEVDELESTTKIDKLAKTLIGTEQLDTQLVTGSPIDVAFIAEAG